MAQEYYIRNPDSEDARGPLSFEQLQSLAEAGQVDSETLYFDENSEDWEPINANKELLDRLIPKKRKLTLKAKAKEDMDMLNVDDDDVDRKVSVDEMLAAAEGTTEETRHTRKLEKSASMAASVAIPVIGGMLLLSALSQIWPSWETVNQLLNDKADPMVLVREPMLAVAVLDLFLALVVFLGATEIYPFLRARMMIGMGYFVMMFYADYMAGNSASLYLMGAVMASSFGLFICTVTNRFAVTVLFGLIGLVGFLTYGMLTVPLFQEMVLEFINAAPPPNAA